MLALSLGLLFFHELLALLSSPLVDGVAWIVDLERVFVLHVGIFYLSALFIKVENMGHPKSKGEAEISSKEHCKASHGPLNHTNLASAGNFPVERIRADFHPDKSTVTFTTH